MPDLPHPTKDEHEKGKVEQCVQYAKSLLASSTGGLRAGELVQRIHRKYPRIPLWTIRASVSYWLPKENGVERFEWGWYRLATSRRKGTGVGNVPARRKRDEALYYEPFALWLCLNQGCTRYAITGGRTKGRGKWTNPDVVALVDCERNRLVEFNTEVVTAEIKVGTGWDDLITAFAQACSYKLCSHLAWVVVPIGADRDAFERLASLCHMFGLGLAKYDPTSQLDTMEFMVEARPRKDEPHYWYANHLIEGKKFKRPPDIGEA